MDMSITTGMSRCLPVQNWLERDGERKAFSMTNSDHRTEYEWSVLAGHQNSFQKEKVEKE